MPAAEVEYNAVRNTALKLAQFIENDIKSTHITHLLLSPANELI